MQVEENIFQYDFTDNKLDQDFPDSLQQMINSVIKKEGYIIYDVQKKNISTCGGNYLGVLYEIDVKGTTAKGKKETNIFMKQIIPSDQIKILSVLEAYKKESFAYNELFKIFKELQDEASVPAEERLKTTNSYSESNTEAILLENLARKGFKTYHRMDVVSLEFAEQAIQQLAKFHALSMALEKQRPQYFEKKIKSLQNPYTFDEDWKIFTRNMCEMSVKKLNGDSKKKVELFVQTFLDKFPIYMGDNTSVGCCLCHGDYRANNILMKETNGELKEIIPIDYQLLYYGCPINDFIYFIFAGTDQEFRKKHLKYLKNLYYETLGKFLKYFEMNISTIFPRKEFERQYAEKLEYGLMASMYLVPLCFAAEDDVPDLGKDELTCLDFKLDGRFEERIKGIVDDFIQWGYL